MAPLLVGGMLSAGHAAGSTYYVSPKGSDRNAGTSQKAPWRSLDRVKAATLKPGDTVLLLRGATFSGDLEIAESGTAAAPISVGAYGSGSAPVVTGSCVELLGSNLRVTGIKADQCSWGGFTVGGDRVTLSGVIATRNVTGVYIRAGAEDAVLNGSTIVDNDRMSVNTPGGSDDSGAFGVLVRGDRALITRNQISGHAAMSYDYGMDGAAVEIYGAIDTTVSYNIARENNVFTELGNSRTSGTTYAFNQVTAAQSDAKFLITRGSGSSWGPVLDTEATHNTVRLTGAESEGFVCHGGCNTEVLTLTANILTAIKKVGYSDGPMGGGYNVWFGGQRQFTLLNADSVADPQWVDPGAANLRLRAGSPALDRHRGPTLATDLDGRPVPVDGDGDGQPHPDAGAYELQ